jgi:O-antigen/teichoic acid export membrane protein
MLNILRSTVKSTFIYSFGTISSRLASFVLIPLYAKKLTLGEFGVLNMLDMSSQVLITLFGLGLFNAFFRWYWDKDSKGLQKSMLFTILSSTIIFSVILSFFGFLFSRQLSNLILGSPEFGYLIKLLMVSVSLETVIVINSTLLRIKDKAMLFSSLMLIRLIISLTLTVYFIIYLKMNVEGVYVAQIISALVYLMIVAFYSYGDIEFKFNTAVLKTLFKYSFPLMIVALTGMILNTTDRYVLKFLTNMDEVGKYSMGFKISNTLRVFIISSVTMAIQPVIFKMIDNPNNKRFYSKVMTYFAFGLMFFVMFFSFFGKEIVKVLSKDNMAYWDAYMVIPIISLGLFFSMLRDVALTGITISKRTTIIAKIITISMVFNILISLVLTYFFNYIGAAIAASLSQLIFFLLAYFYSQKIFYIPYEIRKVALMIAVAVIMYMGVIFIDNLSLTMRLSLKSAMILSFPFILYPFNFYEPIELERIRQFWQKWSKLSNLKGNIKGFKN